MNEIQRRRRDFGTLLLCFHAYLSVCYNKLGGGAKLHLLGGKTQTIVEFLVKTWCEKFDDMIYLK